MPRPIYEMKAEFFKTLSHPARIRVLEILSDGPRSVSELQPDVGIESSHLSQQLAVLRRANIVQSERQGSSMIYSVIDPTVLEVLQLAKQVMMNSLSSAEDMMADLDDIDFETQD